MHPTLRSVQLAKRAMHAKSMCRIHPGEPAATCQRCYAAALVQQDTQWKRQREAAHADYLQRIAQ